MLYPSVTICTDELSGSPLFSEGKWFESMISYLNWKSGAENVTTNYTLAHPPELKGLLYKLSTKNSADMSRMELGPNDLENRENNLSFYYLYLFLTIL